jgi:hypothetical protein
MKAFPIAWVSPADVGKAFLLPDTYMGPDLSCFLQDEKAKRLIVLALKAKVSPKLDAPTRQGAIISVTPQFYYTVVVNIIPYTSNLHPIRPLF